MSRAFILTLALLSAGCHGAKSGAPEPQAETTLRVENRNFLDANIFVVRDGQRIRLGMAPGLASHVFTIPSNIVTGAPQLRFEIHLIGGRGNPRTETIAVLPGDEVVLTIPAS